MKKYILYPLLLLMLSLGACKKYLDKEPDNRTEVSSPDQIAQLLTTAYPQGNYILFCEAMSDNAEDKLGGSAGIDYIDRINRQSYRYEVVETAPDDLDSPDFYWNSCYKAIAAANQALEYIDRAADTAALSPHRGEALVARAYAHFMLVTLFAKAYDPATAATDPGVPYVTAPEKVTFQTYERRTVAYVYEMIEKDLEEGYDRIDDRIYGQAPKFHFNKRAAAAFAARFYLFKREFEKVVDYASVALSGGAGELLRPWNTTWESLQYNQLEAEYTKSTVRGNLLLQEANSAWGRSYPSLRYGLGQEVATELISTPTVSGWIIAYPLYGASPQSYNIPKFFEFFVTETINAGTGDPYNTIPLLTAEEALLNRAEAYSRINNKQAAIDDLNTFLSRNINEYSPDLDNVDVEKVTDYYGLPEDTAMILAPVDLKRVFFLHEGMRWFDILRLKLPVVHTTNTGEVFRLEADDRRKILQLPILTKQAGLEPNQR